MRMIITLVAVLVVATAAFVGYKVKEQETASAVRMQQFVETTYLSKQGWNAQIGTYHLRSFDGGKNWYAVEWTNDGGIKILGPAEDKFPGLLSQLAGMDSLISYVQQHGPLNLTGPEASEHIRLLENAGMKVQPMK